MWRSPVRVDRFSLLWTVVAQAIRVWFCRVTNFPTGFFFRGGVCFANR
ncbi:MAG: hypothetical protein OXF02_02265 [Simkaniaceae bacterium]|nr:hypothetical protein [Simkaniaceae bacterium]